MNDNKNNTEQQQFNIRNIFRMFIRRKWLVAGPLAAGIAIAVLAAYMLPPEYEASSKILIRNKKIVDPLISEIAVSPDLEEDLGSLSEKALAWPHLKQLADELGMTRDVKTPAEMEKLIAEMREKISIKVIGKNLIEIKFQDEKPMVAQKAVTAITEKIVKENMKLKSQEAANAIVFIERQLSRYKNRLENSQIYFSSNEVEISLQKAFNRKKILEDRLKKIPRKIVSAAAPKPPAEESPLLKHLNERLAELEMKKAKLMVDAMPGNPRVAELNKMIEEIRRKIKVEESRKNRKSKDEKESAGDEKTVINPLYLTTEEELKQLEQEIKYLQERKTQLRHAEANPEKNLTQEEIMAMQRNNSVDEDIYKILLSQLESAYVSARLQESENGKRLTVIEPARLPLSPISPDKVKIIFIGLFLGLSAGGGFAFMVEKLDESFRTIEDARSFLPGPVIGVISRMDIKGKGPDEGSKIPDKQYKERKLFRFFDFEVDVKVKKFKSTGVAPEVVAHHDPQNKVSEEYRMLKTRVIQNRIAEAATSIMVTSSVRGEGKSVGAANLAVSASDSSKRTLLIDFDLRQGSIHRLFGISKTPGVAEVAEGRPAKEAIVKTDISNLYVLPRGKKVEKPSELLESDRIKNLVESLKQVFDVIIIDSPPVINLSDPFVVSKYTDSVVMIVQMERTQKKIVMDAYNRLIQCKTDVEGFVLNSVRYYLPKYLHKYYYGEYNYE